MLLACLVTGEDTAEPAPVPAAPEGPWAYMPSAFDEAKADAGDGHQDDSLRSVVVLDGFWEKPLPGRVRGDGHAAELRCAWPSYS